MRILFVLLRHPLHIIEFFRDSNRYLKENKDIQNTPYKNKIKTTYYPDERLEFNEWTQYIHDENYLNHRN